MATIGTLPYQPATASRPATIAHGAGRLVVRAAVRAMAVAVNSIMRWHELRRQKLALRSLDARLLDDIGLSTRDVERAFRPSIWDRLGL